MLVKTAVWVRNPGPTEVVAIKNATLRIAFFCHLFSGACIEVEIDELIVFFMVIPNLNFIGFLSRKNFVFSSYCLLDIGFRLTHVK